MEALVAVGLAGNIVQFIDFTYNLFNGAASIHNSTSGLQKGVRSLETITKDLQDLCAELSRDGSPSFQSRNAAYPFPVQKLARQCSETTGKLLAALTELKAKHPDSKWSCFRAAIATVRKKADIEAWEKTLDGYRMQMATQLQKMQNDNLTHVFGLLHKLNLDSERVSKEMSSQISKMRQEVREAVNGLKEDLYLREALIRNPAHSSESHQSTTVNKAQLHDITAFTKPLLDCETMGFKIMVSLDILDSLTFDQMDFRHSSIHDAHPKTYGTVFEEEISGWLRSEQLFYWVSGKPGSGKSTLMKYIVDNRETITELRQAWNERDPIVASYFFWINGTPLQRSQEGLLRCLLYEILRQNPDWIEVALPKAWASTSALIYRHQSPRRASKRSGPKWNHAELMEAFQRLADAGMTATRLCFFIDGLDEFGGDHEQLVYTIQCLMTMKIKMCVASRPWNIFEEAFGRAQINKLYMQDVNKPDIRLYVKDKIGDRLHNQEPVIGGLDAEKFLEDIVENSKGVFLWVFLVVRSLNEGLRNRDRLSQLRTRLDAIPSDLEEFFNHIFKSMDQEYRVQIAHMFQVALQTKDTLSPLFYWFLDEQEDDPEMALTEPISGIQEEEIQSRIDDMSIRINGRCKGLLEIHALDPVVHARHRRNLTVDFLHRTVKDFLMTTNIRDTFKSWQQKEFDPSLAICQASLALVKSVVVTHRREASFMDPPLQSIFESAKELESKGKMSHKPYLMELEKVSAHPDCRRLFASDAWGVSDGHFASVAIKRDLTLFIKDRFRTSPPCTEHSKIHFLMDSDTLEMTGVIAAFGPPLILNEGMQDLLLRQCEHRKPEEIVAGLHEILRHICFATNEVGQFTWGLNDSLWDKLLAADMDNLIAINFKGMKQHAKKLTAYEKETLKNENHPGKKQETPRKEAGISFHIDEVLPQIAPANAELQTTEGGDTENIQNSETDIKTGPDKAAQNDKLSLIWRPSTRKSWVGRLFHLPKSARP